MAANTLPRTKSMHRPQPNNTLLNYSQAVRPKKNKSQFWQAILAGILGICTTQSLEYIGTLKYDEIICVVCLLFYGLSKSFNRHFTSKAMLGPLLAILLMSAAQLMADFANSRPITDILKGHANFGFALTSTLFLTFLFKDRCAALIVYLISRGVAGFFLKPTFHSDNSQLIADEYWDVRVAYWAAPLVIAGALILVRKQRYLVTAGIAVYGCAAVAFGGRSHGIAYIFCTLALIFATPQARNRISQISARTKRRIRRFIVYGILAFCLFFPVYVTLGLNGSLTDKAQRQLQTVRHPYNPLEVLLAGRGGIEVGAAAIGKRPILGYGSGNYNDDYLDGFPVRRDKGAIHSMMFESFAYGGFVVGCCYVALLWMFLQRCAKLIAVTDYRCTVIGSIYAVSFLWASLASPLQSFRLIFPLVFATTFVFDQQINNDSRKGFAK